MAKNKYAIGAMGDGLGATTASFYIYVDAPTDSSGDPVFPGMPTVAFGTTTGSATGTYSDCVTASVGTSWETNPGGTVWEGFADYDGRVLVTLNAVVGANGWPQGDNVTLYVFVTSSTGTLVGDPSATPQETPVIDLYADHVYAITTQTIQLTKPGA